MTDRAFLRYERLVLDNQNRFESLVQQGDAKPLLLWYALLSMVLPIVALLVPFRKGGWLIRPILFVFTLGLSVEIIRCRRMLLGGNGYLVGVVMVWWLVWSSTLLFFNNVERDFRRIERARPTKNEGKIGQQNGHADGKGHKASAVESDTGTLVWQPYPRSFLHRLGWIFALVMNMRGPDFSFRLSSLGPLPPQLDSKYHHASKHHHGRKRPTCLSPTSRLRTAIVRFFVAYLAIDILKLLIIWDPYFLGADDAPPPYPDYLATIPGLVRAYRLLVSGSGVFFAIQFVTSLNPMFFLGLSLAFPSASRALVATPLDASWLYGDQFGPFAAILDHGLAGAWGTWWHQIFRFGFTSTAKWIISLLPSTVSSLRTVRRIIVTFVAFGISGLLHSMGSYTQIGQTHPVSGTFLFFIMQAVGIFVQDAFSWIVVPLLTHHGLPPPRWLRRTANIAFVVGWLLIFGSRIADDFARGGLWLTEPLPVSFIRGLMGRGWLCWRSAWFEYYDDGTFWGRGVRII